ncbi:MAG: hypothetical protein IJV05_08420 [Muribaculaceae bacterium]|nr:hypothetical protein [Muribaculaceae bacterium]
MPLILDTCFMPPSGLAFKYLEHYWDCHTIILSDDYVNIDPGVRLLPGTRERYPWLTGDDFLQPMCVQVEYDLNDQCFFNGNITYDGTANRPTFLLPLKPKFFEYFTVDDLKGNTDDGRPIFTMDYCEDDGIPTLVAILRVPIAKTDDYGRHLYMTFTRVYTPQAGIVLCDPDNNEGTLLHATDALTVFPFVKLPVMNHYNFQHVAFNTSTCDMRSSSLSFINAGHVLPADKVRSAKRRIMGDDCFFATTYYEVMSDIDAFDFEFMVKSNGEHYHAMLVPLWPMQETRGGDEFTFAVDFGTTNSHIECLVDKHVIPLNLSSDAKKKFIASSFIRSGEGNANLFMEASNQEFLPDKLGDEFKFPQRTVLAQFLHFDDSHMSTLMPLGDVNIPFIYEKESIFYSKVVGNLKWSTDNLVEQRIKAFLTELALLMRTKVILSNGNLAKTRIVWFYPLSMDNRSKSRMNEIWKSLMSDLFGVKFNMDNPRDRGPHDNLIEMPESVAPYYFHRDGAEFRASTKPSVSIDIGGGTSDIVVYVPSVGSKRLPNIITSFRFAANTVFGDAYLTRQADANPMLQKYIKHFRIIYDRDNRDATDVGVITYPVLEDIVADRKSEDISTFLFAIGNKEKNQGKPEYSFNHLLNGDSDRKIVFVYFYASIVYYVAHMLKDKGIALPRHIFFSGTGSKILDILGERLLLNQLSQEIIEAVYGKKYKDEGYDFTVLTSDEPKHITCRGALSLLTHDYGIKELDELNETLSEASAFGRKTERIELRQRYTMLDQQRITYGDMEGAGSKRIQDAVIQAVKDFNRFFINLSESKQWRSRFNFSSQSVDVFKTHINDELDEYYSRFVESYMSHNVNPQQEYEDIPFFYPIAGAIRFNLIARIK